MARKCQVLLCGKDAKYRYESGWWIEHRCQRCWDAYLKGYHPDGKLPFAAKLIKLEE